MAQMMYILGYRENDLNADEQKKLKEHISKWSNEFSKNGVYAPFDRQDERFESIAMTFEEEENRKDNKKIVIYDDLEVKDEKELKIILNAYNELKGLFSDVLFEAHTDKEKLD